MANQTLHQEFGAFIETFKARKASQVIADFRRPRPAQQDLAIFDDVDDDYLPRHARDFLRDCNDAAKRGY